MELLHLTVFVVAAGVLCAAAMVQASDSSPWESEANALLSLKGRVERDPRGVLQGWVAGKDHCSWTGIACSDGGGGGRRVVKLDLSNAGLVGTLDVGELIAALDQLQALLLQGNAFDFANPGPPPPSACSRSLQTIDLSSNSLAASLPSDFLSSCKSLTSLNLSRNAVSGTSSLVLAGAPSISLDLSHNQFSGDALLKDTLSNCGNLTFLDLSANKLAGGLAGSDLSSCRNLVQLNLSFNLLSDALPLGFLLAAPSLKVLDLSHNNLSGDLSALSLGADCGSLTFLDLSFNPHLTGELPSALRDCRYLQSLILSGNSLGPQLPKFLGGLPALETLNLARNRFAGEIPPELGSLCRSLRALDLSFNALVGGIPSTFAACSSLQSINLGSNQLTSLGPVLTGGGGFGLKYLSLPFNILTPTTLLSLSQLSNYTGLQVLDLSSNGLTGGIPAELCKAFPSLQKLLISDNQLTGLIPVELGDCRALRSLDLSFNFFTGPIPPQVWALPELIDLTIWANQLSGEIPDTLCTAGGGSAALETLILNNNLLTGRIPESIINCAKLVWISLSNNLLRGPIPSGFDGLRQLAILQLGNNSLSGTVPEELGGCPNLIWLDLNSNGLTGSIPSRLAAQSGHIVPGVVSGRQFAFVMNQGGLACRGAGGLFEFYGIRQERLAAFPAVHACPSTRIYIGTTVYNYAANGTMIFLDLSFNSLDGSIPDDLGFMPYLQVLNLGHNRLTGTIPLTFGGLKYIMGLDLSYNHLYGSIPAALGTLSLLDDFDVSNNNLSGPIPSSGQLATFPASKYANNSGLCGLPLPPCGSNDQPEGGADSEHADGHRNRSLAAGIVVGIAVCTAVAVTLLLVLWRMHGPEKKEGGNDDGFMDDLPATRKGAAWKLSSVLEPLSINVATFEKPLRKLTFAHLMDATNGFSTESLIGSGGFGEVYRARLKDGCIVAVKKLIHVAGQGDREFMAEMETIGKIKHRNLVPLLGYCKLGEERILVYEYMKWGSLDNVLHNNKGDAIGVGEEDDCNCLPRRDLDWSTRRKIAIGSARGLAFLHHSCIPHIIHRDMKSSNVLLDENLEARVSDFGMARLMNALDTHLSVSTLAGTPGYVPPEYYQSFRCTTKGDVYSYGVVLLELLSGKKPIDPVEFGDSNLVGWAKQLVRENRASAIFDPALIIPQQTAPVSADEQELYQCLKIACQCLDDRPLRRPTMIQVMAMFKELCLPAADSDGDTFSVAENSDSMLLKE